MPELTILVPCRDDAATLGAALAAVNDVVTHNSMDVETLVVDDESGDGTVNVALELADVYPALHVRVLARKRLHHGFGGVLRYGMAYARGRYCAIVSANSQDPVDLLPRFLRHLRSGAHLVQCSRYLCPEDEAKVSTRFRLYQRIYRLSARVLLGLTISDTTYGFRAFDRIFVQSLGLSGQRFNVCPEMTLKVLLCGGAVEYVPGGQRSVETTGGLGKFKLAHEIGGYAYVLLRAALHRFGIFRWF